MAAWRCEILPVSERSDATAPHGRRHEPAERARGAGCQHPDRDREGIAAALTGSAALLAETLHTVADAGNEVFLYVAIRRSAREPDATHPFGYGPEPHYWALLAAIGMFTIGGAVSIWEGIRALIHPPELDDFWVRVGVLLVALVLDGASRTVAGRALRTQARARGVDVRTLLRESADPTVTTVYLKTEPTWSVPCSPWPRSCSTGSPGQRSRTRWLPSPSAACSLLPFALRLLGRNRQLLREPGGSRTLRRAVGGADHR